MHFGRPFYSRGVAYSYSDWTTYTDAAARLVRLNAHIAEIADEIKPDMSSAAGSVGRGSIVNYYNSLLAERRRLEVISTGASSGFTRGRAL